MTADRTQLVDDMETRPVLTLRREAGARDALLRGLAEYLETVAGDWAGRPLKFKRVVQTWADAETDLAFPSAAVAPVGELVYGGTDPSDDALTPRAPERVPGSHVYVRVPTGVSLSIRVEVWATDAGERAGLAALLEDAFFPVQEMTGFRLALPHYHGVHADFLPVASDLTDDAEADQERRLILGFRLTARCPLVRVVGPFPASDVRFVAQTRLPGEDAYRNAVGAE